jgi:hypothetical protein
MTTPTPPHPLHALTTFELSRYRRELEHSLRSLPTQAPARAQLQQQLAQAMAEQDSRTQIYQANQPGPGGR